MKSLIRVIINKTNIFIFFLSIFLFLADTYTLTWPIPEGSPGRYSITSTLGEFRSATRTHKGIDIGVKQQPVLAAEDGMITGKGYTDSTGYYLEINKRFRYYHLEKDDYFNNIKVGDYVREGQRIATSGNSGVDSRGNPYPYHLHFEVGDRNNSENPLLYFEIPDTNNGVIGEVYFKSVDKLLVLKDGMIFNKSKPFPESGEFIVNAYDISNTGSNRVNFYKIVSIFDNKVLKERQ